MIGRANDRGGSLLSAGIPAALAAIVLSVVLPGCSDPVVPTARPPATRMVGFSGDPFSERGIRPDPNAADPGDPGSGAILVEWNAIDPSRLGAVRLGGYRLYRSDTVDAGGRALGFELVRNVALSGTSGDTVVSDSTVRLNRGYSYYVTAYSRSDESVESDPSDTVRFTLTERPVPLAPSGNIALDSVGGLRLAFGPSSASGYVAVELDETLPSNESVVLRRLMRELFVADFNDPHVVYSGDSLQVGHRYRWRVEKIFPQGQPIGNSSRWVTFFVNQ
jgi:hypothetical protein